MDEYELHGHLSEKLFRAIGNYFAKISRSVGSISEEIYSRQAVYFSYTSGLQPRHTGAVSRGYPAELERSRQGNRLETHELRGDSYWLAGSNYNRRLADIQSLFNQALYAGLRLTAGEVEGRIDNQDDDLLLDMALSLNGRTPIGPFIVSLGAVNNDAWSLRLSVGRPMREGSIVDEIR